MEQKKTLWITAAAGIFLLIVVGAALILYSPSLQNSAPVQTYYNPAEGWVNAPKAQSSVAPIAPLSSEAEAPAETAPVTPVEPVAPEAVLSQNQGVAPVKVENVTVITDNALVYGTGSTTTIDLNQLKSNPAEAINVTPQNAHTAGVMNHVQQSAPVSQYTPAPDSYYAPAPKAPAPRKEAEAVKPAAKVSEPAKTTAKTTASPKTTAKAASTKTTSKTTAKTASKPAAPSTYWIQVGSYEAKKSADDARALLEKNKIPNEVFTYKDAKGKLFYRVRVGPYTTKSEAEYWQKRIANVTEFAKTNSYIVSN